MGYPYIHWLITMFPLGIALFGWWIRGALIAQDLDLQVSGFWHHAPRKCCQSLLVPEQLPVSPYKPSSLGYPHDYGNLIKHGEQWWFMVKNDEMSLRSPHQEDWRPRHLHQIGHNRYWFYMHWIVIQWLIRPNHWLLLLLFVYFCYYYHYCYCYPFATHISKKWVRCQRAGHFWDTSGTGFQIPC